MYFMPTRLDSCQFVKGGVGNSKFFNFLFELIKIYRKIENRREIVLLWNNAGQHLKKDVNFI